MQESADIEWLAIENKTRRLVKELIEPTVRRVVEDREQLSRISKESELLKRKVDEFEFTASKVNKRLAAIDDVSKRQLDLEAGQKTVEGKMVQTAQGLKADMELLTAEIQRKADYIKNFEKQIETVNGAIQEFHTKFDEMKEALRVDLEEKHAGILLITSEMKDNHNSLKETTDSLIVQQLRVNEKLGDSAAESETQAKLISAIRLKLESIDSEKALKSTVNELKDDLDRLRTKTIAEKESVSKKLKSIRSDLESQFPYQCQLLVAEWMHEVLDSKSRKRLCEHEAQKYQMWIDACSLPALLKSQVESAFEVSKIAAETLKAQEKDPRSRARPSEQLDRYSNSSNSHSSSPKRKHRNKASGKVRLDTEESVKKTHEPHREKTQESAPARPSPTSSKSRNQPADRVPAPPARPDRLEAHRISAIREELNPTPQFHRVDPALPAAPSIQQLERPESIMIKEVPMEVQSPKPPSDRRYSKPPSDVSSVRSPRHERQSERPQREIAYPQVAIEEVQSRAALQEVEEKPAISRRTQEETESLGQVESQVNVVEAGSFREDSASVTSRPLLSSRRGRIASRSSKPPREPSPGNSSADESLESPSVSRPYIDSHPAGDTQSSHANADSSQVIIGNTSGNDRSSEHHSSAYRNLPSDSSKPSHVSASPEPKNPPKRTDTKSSVYSAQATEFVAYFTDESGSERSERLSADDNVDLSDIRGQIEALSQRINTEMAVLRDELSDRYGDFMKDIKQNTEACNTLSRQVLNECAGLHSVRKRDKNDILRELGNVSEEVHDLRKQNETYLGTVDKLAELLAHIVEFCRIGLALSAQDEDDRESIALMGYRETQTPTGELSKTPVISLDKTCLSCTGQSSIVISAFKMACLAYAPTPLSYRSATFQRKELLEIQKRVLESAWTKVNTSDPWSRLKLKDMLDAIPLPKIRGIPSTSSKMSPTWGSPMAPVFSETPDANIDETPTKRAPSTIGEHLPALPKASPGPIKRRK